MSRSSGGCIWCRFTVEIPAPEQDTQLKAKLKAEHPAILDWMIEGAVEWRKHGLKPPACVVDATQAYLAAEDSFTLWREANTDLDPKAWESIARLWNSWQNWAGRTGESAGTQRAFCNALLDHGFVAKKRSGARGYFGVKLHSVPGAGYAATKNGGVLRQWTHWTLPPLIRRYTRARRARIRACAQTPDK
jgi:putative DNA primase/helicase